MRWTAPLRPVGRTCEGLLDRVLCVIGVIAFCQLPEFIQQYRQRLGGRLDEARRQLEIFENTARQSRLSLDQLIERTHANTDSAVARLGGVMQGAVERVAELSRADAALSNASLWKKPFVFAAHFDPSIAAATWDIYRPAVPTTIEGLVYAAMGMLVVLGLYHGLIRYPISACVRRRAARRHAANTTSPTA